MELAQNLAELQVLTENFIKRSGVGLADTEFKVMVILKAYGECSPKIVISKVGILKTNLALVLKKLVAEDLVMVRKNTQDGRSKFYALTKRGEEMMNGIFSNISSHLSHIVTEDFFYAVKIVLSVLNKKL